MRHKPAWCLLLALGAWACGSSKDVELNARRMTGGDPSRGPALIHKYGCGACHTIEELPGVKGKVGPPLTGIGERVYLAGQLPNTPRNMMRWIQDPQTIERGTAMPDMGVTDQDARDLAAYLYTLR
jgi:cytochrome c2